MVHAVCVVEVRLPCGETDEKKSLLYVGGTRGDVGDDALERSSTSRRDANGQLEKIKGDGLPALESCLSSRVSEMNLDRRQAGRYKK